MPLFDISRPLYTGAPHWPGDTPTELAPTARMLSGASCNVGKISLSLHNGTHVDAPYHYNQQGLTIEQLPLDPYLGAALVIDARGHQRLTIDLFAGFEGVNLRATPRILFRTDTWGDDQVFPEHWPIMDPTLPAWLASHGVKLIGIDVPSVDELQDPYLPLHHRLDAAGIFILESLDLRGVEPGGYELIALPLKLQGGDGSPVRAILRRGP